jgi:oxygen-dependent protoporphyrinogen oxidase
MLRYSSDVTSRRYIQLNDTLHLAPSGPIGALTTQLLPFLSKLRVLKEPFVPKRTDGADETVYDFACRRLGRGMTDNLIATLIGGIYAGDSQKISLKSAFPWMHQMEQEHGGLFKGMLARMKAIKAERQRTGAKRAPRPSTKLISSDQGMQGLIKSLSQKCDGVDFRYSCPVKTIEKTAVGYNIHTDQGVFAADKVISCCNAHDAAELFKGLDDILAAAFGKINFAPILICSMGFDRSQVRHPLDGFGYLVAPADRGIVLGTLFSSSLYAGRAPEGKVLLTSITVGDRGTNRGYFDLDDATLQRMVYDSAKEVLGLKGEPDVCFKLRTQYAIPQYYVGHSDIVSTINSRAETLGGLYIAGNSTNGISVADCVLNSRNVAEKVIAGLA